MRYNVAILIARTRMDAPCTAYGRRTTTNNDTLPRSKPTDRMKKRYQPSNIRRTSFLPGSVVSLVRDVLSWIERSPNDGASAMQNILHGVGESQKLVSFISKRLTVPRSNPNLRKPSFHSDPPGWNSTANVHEKLATVLSIQMTHAIRNRCRRGRWLDKDRETKRGRNIGREKPRVRPSI